MQHQQWIIQWWAMMNHSVVVHHASVPYATCCGPFTSPSALNYGPCRGSWTSPYPPHCPVPLSLTSHGPYAALVTDLLTSPAPAVAAAVRPKPSCRPPQPPSSEPSSSSAGPLPSAASAVPSEDDLDATIQNSKDVINRYLEGRGQGRQSGKWKGNSSWKHAKSNYAKLDDKQKPRKRRGKSSRKHATSDYAELDDKQMHLMVDVETLRYSQLSCKDHFRCGRSVAKLVSYLKDRKVRLSAPFLKLSVFETRDEETNEHILRCIDNRRLFALKEYAKYLRRPLCVHINLFTRDIIKEVERFKMNSNVTDGRDVHLRKRKRNIAWPSWPDKSGFFQ